MSKTLTPSQIEARRRMALARNQIETAQQLLGDACANLSSIIGLVPEWERLGELYDRVHAEWHRVNLKVEGGFDLDGSARHTFETHLAAAPPAKAEVRA